MPLKRDEYEPDHKLSMAPLQSSATVADSALSVGSAINGSAASLSQMAGRSTCHESQA